MSEKPASVSSKMDPREDAEEPRLGCSLRLREPGASLSAAREKEASRLSAVSSWRRNVFESSESSLFSRRASSSMGSLFASSGAPRASPRLTLRTRRRTAFSCSSSVTRRSSAIARLTHASMSHEPRARSAARPASSAVSSGCGNVASGAPSHGDPPADDDGESPSSFFFFFRGTVAVFWRVIFHSRSPPSLRKLGCENRAFLLLGSLGSLANWYMFIIRANEFQFLCRK